MTPRRGRQQGSERLHEYRAKRDFDLTPEPQGEGRGGAHGGGLERRFVVQHHRARRQHYDFRLEVDGVLASWAMPKGPTLDPSVRSLAVHVEDHPMEYRDFEGVIPSGQYGAGDVIVWDRGTWESPNERDPAAAITNGQLHFDLNGEKLRGRFVLVRTKRQSGDKEQWLMLHKHDEFAQEGWRPDEHPRSVKSGRTNDEVAQAPEAMWHSDLPPGEAEVRLDGGAEGAEGSVHVDGGTKSPKMSSTVRGRAKSSEAWMMPTDAELRDLDGLADKGTWEFQGREVKLSNLDKVLFDGRDREEHITKRDLIRYYSTVAPAILPYLNHRPVNMHRFPSGTSHSGFWHKEVPKYAPEWLARWHNTEARAGESAFYAVVDSPPALAWMANYAAVELHAWTSRIPNVHEPTWALIDIDPGSKTTFADVVLLARLYKSALDHLGVFAMPKLTGRRGMHIWVPVVPGYTFDDTRNWVERLSRVVGSTVPDLVSWTWQKTARGGLARLDFTQNAINKTLVAPFSVRVAAGAPVSVPIEWEELEDPGLRSDAFTLRSVPRRLAEAGDPFAKLLDRAQRLPAL